MQKYSIEALKWLNVEKFMIFFERESSDIDGIDNEIEQGTVEAVPLCALYHIWYNSYAHCIIYDTLEITSDQNKNFIICLFVVSLF